MTELFVLTLVLILVQGKSKKHIHKMIYETRQGLGFRVSGLRSQFLIKLFTRQDKDKSEERKMWEDARMHR